MAATRRMNGPDDGWGKMGKTGPNTRVCDRLDIWVNYDVGMDRKAGVAHFNIRVKDGIGKDCKADTDLLIYDEL